MKIWLDVESAPGTKTGSGPVIEITSFRSSARLDVAGTWSATVPALDARAMALLQPKRTVLAWAIVGGVQTLIGGGPIDDLAVNLRGDSPSLTVTGLDLLGELAGVGVGTGAIYNGYGLLAGLLPSPWIMLPLDGPPSWYMRYSHESWLGAMVEASGRVGFHFRLAPRPGSPRWIELFTTASSSGVLATANGDALALERNQNACAITSIDETRSAADLANVLYVYGSGDGDARLTLAAATQWPNGASLSLQYTDRDGNTWGVDRNTSKLTCVSSRATYGSHEAPVTFADVAPLSNTAPDMQAAANFLLAAAIQTGRRLAVPQYTYRLSVAGLRKQVLPGQTIHVTARRYIDGQRPINIDRNLVVLEVGTAVDASGVRVDDMTVSTLDKWPITDATMVASTIREVQAMAAHPQMSAALDTISYREPIDDDHTASLPFWLGSEVTTVSQVLLRFRTDPLRSTTKAAAGSSTSSGPSSESTSDSSSESSSLSANANHGHEFSLANSVVGTPVYYNSGIDALVCSGGGDVGIDTTNANHTHGIAHTHGMGHTHTFTPNVSLAYGIYEDPNPYAAADLEWAINGAPIYTPATDAGGGWYALDLTGYVYDPATFRPQRADNTISVYVRSGNRNGRRVQVTAQVSLRTVIQAVGYRA